MTQENLAAKLEQSYVIQVKEWFHQIFYFWTNF